MEVDAVRVGYVAGAGDGVPEALDRMGVDWTDLRPTDLAIGDLDRFDVIVTGSARTSCAPTWSRTTAGSTTGSAAAAP